MVDGAILQHHRTLFAQGLLVSFTGQHVAVKVLPASVLGKELVKELLALASMSHPNIVQLYGTQVDLDSKRVNVWESA